MGDRYTLTIDCPVCGYFDDDVWYAPTCGVITWTCPNCDKLVNLEEYSGISTEGCTNTEEGLKAVMKLKKKINKK